MSESGELAAVLAQLRRGGVVAAATESFVGLLADPFLPGALRRVFELKGRDATRASALMMPSHECWPALVRAVPPIASTFARRFWPGPLTVVLPAAPALPAQIVMNGGVGVRVPGASVAAEVVAAYGGPLTATSANLAGEPPCVDPSELHVLFSAAIASGDLLVLGGVAAGAAVSTLVSVNSDGFSVIRQGAISAAELAQALEHDR